MSRVVIDDRISWCRLFAVGPACPFVCGGCKRMDAAVTGTGRHFPPRVPRTRTQTTLQPVPLVTTREVADAMNVTRPTVIRWCERGLLPGAFRIPSSGSGRNRHWRIPAKTLDDLLAGRLRPEDGAP